MRCLVIGGTGLIGSALVDVLKDAGHHVDAPPSGTLNLINNTQIESYKTIVPGVAFLCAGIKGIKPNEVDRVKSWRTNVDGNLMAGIVLMRAGSKLVYVSTDAVEWLDCHYTRQKALVEVGLLAAGRPVIVRPSTVSKERAPEFAKFMVDLVDKPGIHYWS